MVAKPYRYVLTSTFLFENSLKGSHIVTYNCDILLGHVLAALMFTIKIRVRMINWTNLYNWLN